MSLKGILGALNPIDIIKDGISVVGNLIDNLTTTDEEKAAAKLKLKEVENNLTSKFLDLEVKTVEAKERIMVAELNQSDNYTKRARPTVIYAGLIIVFINHVVLPWAAFFIKSLEELPEINMPSEFWIAWGAVVSVYAVGRTKEKLQSRKTKSN